MNKQIRHYDKDLNINTLLNECNENFEWYKRYVTNNYPRIYADFVFLKKYLKKDDKVLDIGAVPPLLLHLFRREGFEKLNLVDPHPEAFRKYCEINNINVFKGNILDSQKKFEVGEYDYVLFNEVMEHLSGNLVEAFEKAVNCIKPNGYFYLTTPNLRSLTGVYALLRNSSGLATKANETVRAQYDRNNTEFGYYGHVREYTKKEVVQFMNSFGMSLVDCSFQADYRTFKFPRNIVPASEKIFKQWGLFGKYLFKKNEII